MLVAMNANPSAWEAVHTVHDYCDGALVGVADLSGRPHAYNRQFDENLDEWSNDYWLSPLTDDQFAMIKADWGRWLRWQDAFATGALGPADEHPVLAIDRADHDRFKSLVAAALEVDRSQAVRMLGKFEGSKVCWTPRN